MSAGSNAKSIAKSITWITPDWPASSNVRALSTLRGGGVSSGTYASLNLATHVGDELRDVERNRKLLREAANLPAEPMWLEQVHGATVWNAGQGGAIPPRADAAVAHGRHQICTILTADCLPVLFCDLDGSAVGAAHAGWRGLVAGVLTETVKAMDRPAGRIRAWLGPAIEQSAFEVGDDVRDQFFKRTGQHADAFAQNEHGRWQCDIYRLARTELELLGIAGVYGGGFRVNAEADRFFSYRRDKQTGRMATMIWLE
jgi:YfiH family protein